MLTNTVTSTGTATSSTYTVNPNYWSTNAYTCTGPTYYCDISQLEEKIDKIQISGILTHKKKQNQNSSYKK